MAAFEPRLVGRAALTPAKAPKRKVSGATAPSKSVIGRVLPRTKPAGARVVPKPQKSGIERFLHVNGRAASVVEHEAGDVLYRQGDACDAVRYLRAGAVKLSLLSKGGREAVLGLLGPGDFFGEGCLTGQPVHLGSATTISASTIVRLDPVEMLRLLHSRPEFSDRFIRHVLKRNIRVEADLVDQLFNSSEKRLARALLLLARYGEQDRPIGTTPRVSQSTLADMVGTTRSRVNFFMKKFERLGFIEYKKDLKVNRGLLTVVLND